jgi:hypothetical protein
LAWHFGQTKIPTLNADISAMALCFTGVTVQHLTATAASVPQFGHSTNEWTPRSKVHAISKSHFSRLSYNTLHY